MKPLLRWTIGPVHDCGFDTLALSVRKMKSLYDFDMVICYNQLGEQQVKRLEKLDVVLLDQTKYIPSDRLRAPRVGYSVEWKLFPPRLRPESHELFVDNDIIFHKPVETIKTWLETSDTALLYQGLHGLHGAYSTMVPQGYRINSGIFGLPPDFDFAGEIKKYGKPFKDYFDEQGLVACVLTRQSHFIVPLTEVPIIESNWTIESHYNNKSCCGYHFVHANKKEHPAFRKYMREIMI